MDLGRLDSLFLNLNFRMVCFDPSQPLLCRYGHLIGDILQGRDRLSALEPSLHKLRFSLPVAERIFQGQSNRIAGVIARLKPVM